jgi:NADP-dependent 3-hydroxy acid dehydrogenase YdfG
MSIKTRSIGDWHLLLSDKVVFLTGGAGWIARHIAKTCYEHGARIVLADLNIDTIIKVKNEIFNSENPDDRILPVELDVQNEETIKKAIELTLTKWNTIHILINTFVESKISKLFLLDLHFMYL